MARAVAGAATEPVTVATAVRYVLGVLVTLGWLNIPDTTVNAVATGVAALVDLGMWIWSRSRTTPTADPRDHDGTALIRATLTRE